MTSRKGSAKAKRAAAARARLEEDFTTRDDARRRKGCSSKKRYRTRQEAEMAVFACSEYGTDGLSVYHCPYCDAWHLTSHPF